MSKIAYIILAHKKPFQIERLIQALSAPGVHFYIHLDKKISIEPFLFLGRMENVFLIQNRVLVNWGTFSLTRAILSSIEEITSGERDYTHIGFISGQDYPINPVKNLYAYLGENPQINLIHYLDQDHEWYKEAKLRTDYYFCNGLPIPGKYKIEYLLNLFFRKFRFKHTLPFYGAPGSTFMILSKDCCLFLLEKINGNRSLKFHLEFTWGPDEFIFQTLIMHSPFKDHVKENILYYMNWEGGGLHPKTFTHLDKEELELRPEYLARKFDVDVDTQILDLLDIKIKSHFNLI